MKKIYSLFIFLLFFLVFKTTSFADENFANSFDITYSVSDAGITHAVFNGTLTNTTDKYYASSYTLQVGFDTVKNLSAYDNDGAITPQVKSVEGGQAITIPFNHKAIGLNSSTNFTISFDTPNIASKLGQIWEINIPGIANQADFTVFTVHLRVPASFGKPAYIKPVQENGNSLDFDKNALGGSGISLAFGQNQNFNFTLDYHLQNDNLFPVKTEIALPPSTGYQDVSIDDISPRPKNVTIDTDGNWLAQYTLLPSQKMEVTVKGTSFLSLSPKQEVLSDQQRKLYVSQQPFWESDNDAVKKLAKDLKTPEAIFAYVVGHLHYDFSRIAGQQERLGALTVLNNPSSAVCLEFTDLFIAIARAAGIPAREVDGYAYTENAKQRPLSLVKDILHAWPEYYDDNKQAWIMVDPTWQNTTHGTDYFHTLDFDHFAFVVKGQKSTYPVPAGGYKLADNENTKDVFVSFAQDAQETLPKLSLAFDISPQLFSGVPIKATMTVVNAGSVLLPKEDVLVTTGAIFPHEQHLSLENIPPFGTVSMPLEFRTPSFLTNAKDTITIQVAGSKITKTISVYPIFFQKQFILGGTIFVIFCLIILIVATKAWRIFAA